MWILRGLLLLALVCFAFAPTARAQLNPPPDGGYPNNSTAEGTDALFSLTTGVNNTAIGFHALFANTAGNANTAIGFHALFNNTGGAYNTATGHEALSRNTTGTDNTATGENALTSNISGNYNIANGASTLASNSTGDWNTAVGTSALAYNRSGNYNTANGAGALYETTIGNSNTATGLNALLVNVSGSFNTAGGFYALASNSSGNNNIALGASAGVNVTGSNNIDIGNVGVRSESNQIRIGTKGTHNQTTIAGIFGVPLEKGVTVIVDRYGRLGTIASSKRFKEKIQPMDKASEAILALQPVTFRYKREVDSDGIAQFGLVAEEVEKVNPDLVARDDQGKAYTVRYEAVNAMLLNEFLKEHRKGQEQDATIAQVESTVAKQEATIAQMKKQIEVLTKTCGM